MPAPEPHATIELVKRAQAGDTGALDDILRRYYPHVLRIVRARLGAGLRRVAESGDVVQEAMGEVVVGLDDFRVRDDDAFIKWIASLVENRIRDLAKFHAREKRDLARVIPLAPPPGDSAPGIDPARSTLRPDERAAENELADRVRAAIAGLQEHQQEVIALRSRGLPWPEIAERLGLPSSGAARMLHARARVELMKRVGGGSGGD
ncbi:MAG: sigma-70 family RNA polymerase sigma factor [Planctomycetota bacterium]